MADVRRFSSEPDEEVFKEQGSLESMNTYLSKCVEKEEKKKNNTVDADTGFFAMAKEKVIKDRVSIAIMVLLLLSMLNSILILIKLILGYAGMLYGGIWTNPIYCVLSIVLPVGCWVAGTCFDWFNFLKFKLFVLYYAIANGTLILTSMFFACTMNTVGPILTMVGADKYITENMLVYLAQIVCFVLGFGFVYILYRNFIVHVTDELVIAELSKFKLKHYLDLRKDKEYLYDNNSIRNLDTGKLIPIREQDRFTQGVADGPSGTGKTSLILIRTIQGDIERKARNKRLRELEYAKMISAGEAELINSNGDQIKDSDVRPYPAFAGKYKEINDRYPDCGITVFAPNEDLTDDVVEIAKAWGFGASDINVIDPVYTESGAVKEFSIGSNIFAQSEFVPEWKRAEDVASKGSDFADILEALNLLKGSTDAYFSGINRACIENVAILCILAVPKMYQRNATLSDIATGLADFETLKPLLDIVTSIPEYQDTYKTMITFIETEMLGAGKKDMFTQSRGLRNLVNDLLIIPSVKRVMCEQHCIDWDYALANGQITVVNYARILGAGNSTAFGLSSLLAFNQAVLRRPGKTRDRMRHFLFVDELTYLVSDKLEDNFSFFRQYRVAILAAYQTLEQFKKTKVTEYLAGIVQTVGTHILFGRVNTTEMEMYQKLAGTKIVQLSQKTKAHSSYAEDNPSASSSERITPTETDAITTEAIRGKDFKEVTVFMQQDGRVLDVMAGKLDFLTEEQKHPKEVPSSGIPWSQLVTIPSEVFNNDDVADTGATDSVVVDTGIRVDTIFEKQTSADVDSDVEDNTDDEPSPENDDGTGDDEEMPFDKL